MKSLIKLFLLILIADLQFGCKIKNEKFPAGWGFKVVSETFEINSFDSTYLRRYIQGDSIVNIHFSEDELKKIHDNIIRNKLDKFPDNFYPDCQVTLMPCSVIHLQFNIHEKTKNLTYLSSCRYFPLFGYLKNKKYKKLFETISLITDIANSKPEVKKLVQSNLIFL